MQNFAKLMPVFVYRFARIIGIVVAVALSLFVLVVGIRYPIPWLWQHLLKIFSIPLIVLWIAILCILSLGLYIAATSLTERLAFLFKDASVYLLALTTNSPVFYSQIKPVWGATLLSKLPVRNRVTILENIDKTQAWNILCVIEQKSDAEFIELLRNMGGQKINDFLFLERISRRHEIIKRIGIQMYVGEDTKPYMTHNV